MFIILGFLLLLFFVFACLWILVGSFVLFWFFCFPFGLPELSQN